MRASLDGLTFHVLDPGAVLEAHRPGELSCFESAGLISDCSNRRRPACTLKSAPTMWTTSTPRW